MDRKDYYKILEIDKNASQEEIKKSFRKLAHKYHPDKNGGDDSKFKEVNEAYQVLSDEKKRAQYDQFGSYNAAGGGYGGFDPSGFSGFDFSGFGGNGGSFEFDVGDIFGEMFGGFGNNRHKGPANLHANIGISFKESIFGTTKNIKIYKKKLCETCKGSGGEPSSKKDTCKKCNGKGKIDGVKQTILGSFRIETACDDCNGVGVIYDKKCHICNGKKLLNVEEALSIKVPAGILSGQRIKVTGKGDDNENGLSGDLYIDIQVAPDKSFTRDGVNIITKLEIGMVDAVLGSKIELETLDGKSTVSIPAGIQSGDYIRIKNKGVPVGHLSKRGDLLIKIIVKIPKSLTKEQKRILSELKEVGL